MISEKIKKEINKLSISVELKQLMLKILEEEDKGNYKYKDTFDKLVNKYLEDEEGKSNDQNSRNSILELPTI